MPQLLKLELIIVFTILCSCSSPSSVTLDSNFEKSNYNLLNTPKCGIIINSIEDHRKDKESLGNLYYIEVFSENPLLWVSNGFKTFGIVNKKSLSESTDHIKIDVILKLAHVNQLLSTKAANVVLGISQDSYNSIEYFRGSHASINWNGSKEEIKGAFDLSLSKSIQKIIGHLDSSCKTLDL